MLLFNLIIALLLSLCSAVPAKCLIGSTGYYFSTITFEALNAQTYCQDTIGQLAELHEIDTSVDALREWLEIRRGMRACNVTQAWVFDLDVLGLKNDHTVPDPNALIDPAGIQPHNQTGQYYVLCQLTP